MKYLLVIACVLAVILLLRVFRRPITKWVFKLRAKYRMNSLKQAIVTADESKGKNGRKNLVVFNNSSGIYESLEKRTMKVAQKRDKVKGQPAKTKYRAKKLRKFRPGRFTHNLIKKLEKKSPYVTK